MLYRVRGNYITSDAPNGHTDSEGNIETRDPPRQIYPQNPTQRSELNRTALVTVTAPAEPPLASTQNILQPFINNTIIPLIFIKNPSNSGSLKLLHHLSDSLRSVQLSE
jgi:hypothetical protein